ncbi:MAG: glycosyltransferase [archaeon]|nr:glycosyltransferase [archaeon]
MKTVLGPYPPPYAGTELVVREEFEELGGNTFLIGTSLIPIELDDRILIRRNRFAINGPSLIYHIMRRRKYITSISAHFATTFGYIAHLAKKWFEIPYTVTCHGTDALINLKRKPHSYFTKKALQGADRVYVVSESIKDAVLTAGIPEDVIEIKQRDVGKAFSGRKIKKKKQVIFVGSVHHIKGVDILLAAFAEFSKKNKTYNLKIVGRIIDPSYLKLLKNLAEELGISDKVHFVGEMPHDHLPKYLNESALFVMPSRSEGYGRALDEALTCGLPAVATNVGGLPELAKGRNCIIVESELPGQMAAAMQRAIEGRGHK